MVMNTESRVEKDPAGAAILFAQDGPRSPSAVN